MSPRRMSVLMGAAIVLMAPLGADSLLLAACGAVLALLGGLLLRPHVPAVFALVAVYQWAQVSIATLYANATGGSLEHLYPVGDIVRATAYGLLVVVVSVLGCTACAARWPTSTDRLVDALRAMSLSRIALAWAVVALVGLPLERMVGVMGRISQLVQALGDLRWAFVFLLVAAALVQRRGAMLAASVLLLEVLVGFSGFFAGFAEPMMLALLAFVSVFGVLRSRQRLAAVVLAMALLGLGIVWQGVKNEYRQEVSGGTGEQVVTVGLGERYALLGRMAGESFGEGVARTAEKFALRLAYVQNFGLVLHRVPAEMPHRGGELLAAAVTHVLVPRAIFPDKPPLPSDSELTALYTANVYLLYMPGTSISLGYVAELFIDFGLPGVLLSGLILAALLCGVHAAFQRVSPDPALALALATGVLLQARAFETALPKLIGGVLAAFLVQWLLIWLLRDWLLPLLRGAGLQRMPPALAGDASR